MVCWGFHIESWAWYNIKYPKEVPPEEIPDLRNKPVMAITVPLTEDEFRFFVLSPGLMESVWLAERHTSMYSATCELEHAVQGELEETEKHRFTSALPNCCQIRLTVWGCSLIPHGAQTNSSFTIYVWNYHHVVCPFNHMAVLKVLKKMAQSQKHCQNL